MTIKKISVKTKTKDEFVDITEDIKNTVFARGIKEGVCIIFVAHTTAALTINENADPFVKADILHQLDKTIPQEDGYKHREGNSAAHIKSSMFGFSQSLIIKNGEVILGTWQGVYLVEFDGPRNREVFVKIIAG
ncbi:MAG: secondary thiamine-phosphate synthase enzyme YjbQ [Candidatus Gygaella obscura]|nr:secondary thiamine-phosphate synthase enzyme YjbQ [Candidatus Gygaella obscura]